MNINKIAQKWENNYKNELLEIIPNDYEDSEIEGLITYLENTINNDGLIDELIDSKIDTYYYDLRVWAVENYGYIEDALEEFGTSKDYHKDIQMGQYVYYSEEISEAINELIDYIKDNNNV